MPLHLEVRIEFWCRTRQLCLTNNNDDGCELFELELISSGSFTLDPKSSIRASLVNINVTNNNAGVLNIFGVINASGLGWIPSRTRDKGSILSTPFCEKADGPKYLMGGSFGGTGGGFLAPASDGGGGMACSQGDPGSRAHVLQPNTGSAEHRRVRRWAATVRQWCWWAVLQSQ